jgi:predicted dehydrogenase
VTATVPIRWGVAGPGDIATRFADAMQLVDGGTISAVASRRAERADEFADRFAIQTRHSHYDALADDPDVDVVYVSTPHVRHASDTLRFLEAGKHVLCEKPFALNADQAAQMVHCARDRGLFLMEAMWSRFLPAYRVLGEVLSDGRIGEPRLVEADFGFRMPIAPEHRLFDLALGGGALLDLGIYPVQLCALVLGQPDLVTAAGHVGTTGVDEQVAAILHHEGGALGVVKAAIRTGLACTARIAGTEGWIEIPAWMHCPDRISVHTIKGPDVVAAPFDGDGLQFQIDEVHRCLQSGLTECPTMPLDETIAIAGTLDQIRAQIGVRYPSE